MPHASSTSPHFANPAHRLTALAVYLASNASIAGSPNKRFTVPLCPINGCRNIVFLKKEQLHYCPACRHGWVDQEETPNQYEQDYFSTLNSRSSAYDQWLRARYSEMLGVSRQLLPGMRTALDVGCGQGEFLAFLVEHAVEAEGLETSVRYSADCRARGLKVHTGPSTELENRPVRYDLVSCLHVLEHLAHPDELLRSLRNLARPGGLIYIELPNELNAWRSRVKRMLGKPASTPEGRARTGHRQCFSDRSIRRLAVKNGCEILRVQTRDLIEPQSSVVRRLVVGAANTLAKAHVLQGNVISCWCRVPENQSASNEERRELLA